MIESTLSAFPDIDEKLSNLCIVIEKNNIDKLIEECSEYVNHYQSLEIIKKKLDAMADNKEKRNLFKVYAKEFRKTDAKAERMKSSINRYIISNYKANSKQTLINVDTIFSNTNYVVPNYIMKDIVSNNGGNLELSPNGLHKVKVYVERIAVQKEEKLQAKKAIQKKERLAKKKQIKEMKKAKVQNQNKAIAKTNCFEHNSGKACFDYGEMAFNEAIKSKKEYVILDTTIVAYERSCNIGYCRACSRLIAFARNYQQEDELIKKAKACIMQEYGY